jgi:hypothetical protein
MPRRTQDSEAAAADDIASPALPTVGPAALRRFVGWTLAGVAMGVAVMLIALRAVHRDPTPPLTPEIFAAAHERSKAAAPANYDIEVRVTGPQAATYRVEVRGGDPQAAWRNGQPLTTRRTFGTWSVKGMFSTMSRDVEANERAAAANKQQPLILRAEFDQKYHYPARYRRIDNGSRKGGDSITVAWEVTEFRVAEP